MSIIAINGYSGSGKDTVGNIIQDLTSPEIPNYSKFQYGEWIPIKGASRWQIKKFAAKLKEVCSILTGIPIEKFEDQEFKKTELGPEWNRKLLDVIGQGVFATVDTPMTVRNLLQIAGTNALRDRLHENVWVNALMVDYVRPSHWENRYYDELNRKGFAGREQVWGELPNWIITDCRFLNEAKAIKDREGIIIRVNRPGVKPVSNHKSETELDNYSFDYVIENDSDLKSLESKVSEILSDLHILEKSTPIIK
jgi:hypothetical protein